MGSSSSSKSKSSSNADVNVDIRIVICQANGGGVTVGAHKQPTNGGATCAAGVDTRAPVVKVPKKKLRAARNRTIPLRLTCPAHEKNGCTGVAKLRTLSAVPNRLLTAAAAKRIVVGKKKFAIRGGMTKTVRLRLTNKSYRVLQKTKKLRVWVKINAQDKAGNKKTTGRAITLLAPKR
jgi:hypothetical protein